MKIYKRFLKLNTKFALTPIWYGHKSSLEEKEKYCGRVFPDSPSPALMSQLPCSPEIYKKVHDTLLRYTQEHSPEMFIHYSYKKVHSSNLYHTTLQCDNVLTEALTVLSLSEHCSVYWELDNTNSLSLQCSSAADV